MLGGIEKKILKICNNKELLCNIAKQNFQKSKEFDVKKLKEKEKNFIKKY